MAVGLSTPDSLLPIDGVELAIGSSRLRKKNDLVAMRLSKDSRVAAVFTLNACRAPVVDLAREHLQKASPRALLINAGNANAGTGEDGLQDARLLCSALASTLGLATEQVLPFSTGVIGERLNLDALTPAVKTLGKRLSNDGWLSAAEAIMTTDTMAKGADCEFEFGGSKRTVTGIAKGGGMICPNMATLLAFVATDAPVPQRPLHDLLRKTVDRSFHRITVDGDTSTNDACVLISTGRPHSSPVPEADWRNLEAALEQVARRLAESIVRDAEGATRFIRISVEDGLSEKDCRQVAYTIAHSPLVKTAVFAGDPNWGRILMALGRSGVELKVSEVCLFLDDYCLFEKGGVAKGYSEQRAADIMRSPEYSIRVLLGQGKASANIWTSDLSYEYVRINSEYRS